MCPIRIIYIYIHACEWHFTYYLHLSKAAYCANCTLPSYRLTSSCLIEANLAGQGGRHLKGAQDPVVIRKMATWYLKIWIWPLEMVVKLIIGEMVKIHQNNSMYIYLSLLFSCIFSCKSIPIRPSQKQNNQNTYFYILGVCLHTPNLASKSA